MIRRGAGGLVRLLLAIACGVGAWQLGARWHETGWGRVWQRCPATGHWYTLFRENLTWEQATVLAERYGGYLASITSDAEQQWVTETYLGYSFGVVYLGLRNDGAGWTWSSGEPVGYTNWWPPDIPSPPDGRYLLGVARGAAETDVGYWYPLEPADRPVSLALAERPRHPRSVATPTFLGALALAVLALGLAGSVARDLLWPPVLDPRRDPPPEPRRSGRRRWRGLWSACRNSPGWLRGAVAVALVAGGSELVWHPGLAPMETWVRRPETGHWYRLAKGLASREAAEAEAARRGGYLACIETPAENRWLGDRLLDRPLYAAWIGLTEADSKGNYIWADGSGLGYENWLIGQPRFESWWPLLVCYAHGPISQALGTVGKWDSVVMEEWYRSPQALQPRVDHALIERLSRPPVAERPDLLLGCLLLALGCLLGTTASRPLIQLCERHHRLAPGLATVALLASAAWLPWSRPESARHDWQQCLVDGQWYALVAHRGDWDQAAELAATAGARLAVVDTAAVNQWLLDNLLNLSTYGAYLGLRQQTNDAIWRWVDGRQLEGWTNWAEWHPYSANHLPDVVCLAGDWPADDLAGRWHAVPRVVSDGAESRPEFALLQRPTNPAVATWRLAGGLAGLLGLAACCGLLAWRQPTWLAVDPGSTRHWLVVLLPAAGLVALAAWPEPLGPTPLFSQPDETAAAPADWPEYLRDYAPPPSRDWTDYRVAPLDGMPQVRIPGGVVSPASLAGVGEANEQDRDRGFIQSFWMDLHEVTVAQYARFLTDLQPPERFRRQWLLLAGEEGGHQIIYLPDGSYQPVDPTAARQPVVNVSWDGARAYAWFYQRRLPLELEWVRAVQGAATHQRYPWGNQPEPPAGAGNLPGAPGATDALAPVGVSAPGLFGVLDLAGNASEWCEDWYIDSRADIANLINPTCVVPTGQNVRRGGSYRDPLPDQRTARRRAVPIGWRSAETGFRTVSADRLATETKARAVLPPEGWPTWLEEAAFVPPVLMNWSDFRVTTTDGMPQVRCESEEFTLGSTRREREDAVAQLPQPDTALSVAELAELEPEMTAAVPDRWWDLHEVTVAQYRRFCEATGHEVGTADLSRGDRYPVTGVTWYDAIAYGKWVDRWLPSEAEWEFAASGRVRECLFWYGRQWQPDRVNQGTAGPTPAGTYGPNGFGLLDMLGNVSEWCQDTYEPGIYLKLGKSEPRNEAPGLSKVHRGGSFASPPMAVRTGARAYATAGAGAPDRGFRCVGRH